MRLRLAAILSRVSFRRIGFFLFMRSLAYFRFVRAMVSEEALRWYSFEHSLEQYQRPFACMLSR